VELQIEIISAPRVTNQDQDNTFLLKRLEVQASQSEERSQTKWEMTLQDLDNINLQTTQLKTTTQLTQWERQADKILCLNPKKKCQAQATIQLTMESKVLLLLFKARKKKRTKVLLQDQEDMTQI